ncbi:MAG: transcriptional regulator protein [Methanohalophilus sp. T328-1]|nr:MAG: transcriptional regulator protein [Methanohalophilus sp. T328-1]RXG34121.1 transcriptional regulator protein [Methanohalophilus sp. WG1-DM]
MNVPFKLFIGVSMEEDDLFSMNENQREIAKLLRRLHLSKPVARTLACLSCGEEVSSRKIESMSQLRQPEVSIAMNFLLKKKGWVEYEEIKRNEGKGRPIKVYKLAVPMESIIESIEQEILSENQILLDNINRLKEFS